MFFWHWDGQSLFDTNTDIICLLDTETHIVCLLNTDRHIDCFFDTATDIVCLFVWLWHRHYILFDTDTYNVYVLETDKHIDFLALTLTLFVMLLLLFVIQIFYIGYFWWRTRNFKFCWLWAAITLVEKLARPKNTTFSESSGRELSHGSIPEKFSLTKMTRGRDFSKKRRFLQFSIAAPKKFKWLQNGQFWSGDPKILPPK